MSDLGIYDSHEAEIVAALQGLDGVIDIRPTLSMGDLLSRDAPRRDCIGIAEGEAQPIGEPRIGTRLQEALVTWELSVIAVNDRGAVNGRPKLRKIVEGIHDRVHGLASTVVPNQKYRWAGEEPVDTANQALCAKVVKFHIRTYFGR